MRFALPLTFLLAPAFGAQAPQAVPDAPPSLLAFPIRIDLDPLFQEAERTAPRRPPGVGTWTRLAEPKGAAFRFDLTRESLRFSLRENRLVLRTEARYWLEVGGWMTGSWYQPFGSCGRGKEGLRRVLLGLRAEADLDSEWRLRLHTRADEPLPLDPCLVTFLGYDITDRVVAGMKTELDKAVQGIERTVQETAGIRQQAERVWTAAQQPLELAPGIHLSLNPERMRLAPWRSEGRTLVLTPELQARPVLTLGGRPSAGNLPLPPLETAMPVAPGFQVRLDLDLPFQEATRQLRAQLVGRTFETDKGRFEVQDALVSGRDGRALLEVQVKGRIEGRLFLAGRPVFDEVRGALRLEGLDYTLDSQSWITRFGEWLFRSSLRRTLQEKADWFLEQRFQDVRALLQQNLNRELLPGLQLRGGLDHLQLGQPEILADRFRVEARLAGRAELEVKGLRLPRQ